MTPTITVNAPATAIQNQSVTFVITVSGPAGVPTPTGTVTLTDQNTGNTFGPATLANGIATITTSSLTPGDHPYYVQYNGDNIYTYAYLYGDIFIYAGLASVSPAAILAKSPATGVRLFGQGFTTSSVVQLVQPDVNTNLTTTFVSATELRAVIPTANLAANGTLTLQVAAGDSTTSQLPVTVYTKYSDQVSVSGNFSSLTYGQAGHLNLTGSVTRGATTDAAVPSGAVSFLLNGTSYGSAQLKLANAPVTTSYLTGSRLAIDNQPAKLLAADFNRDGYTDVIGYSSSGGYYLQLFLGAGANSFLPETEVYTGCQSVDFAIGDLNKDGIPDIVVACNSPSPGPYAVYLLGNGNGTFQTPVALATSANTSITSPTSIAAGDFNGDGALDVALMDGNGNLQVFLGSQTFGTFTPQPATTYPTLTSTYLMNVVAADFNQDGKSDLALLEYGYTCECPPVGNVVVLTSTGNGTFKAQQQSFNTTASSLQGLAVLDLNGDGYPDVAVADPGSPNSDDSGQVLIYENDATGQLKAPFSYAAPNALTVVGPPFPSTGKPAAASQPPWTLFYASYDPDSTAIQLISLLRQSATNYSELYSNLTAGYTPYSDGGVYPIAMVAGDWNGDGYLDLFLNAQSTANNYSTSQVTPVFFGTDSAATLAGLAVQPNAGTYAVTAAYPGDVNFAAGTSAPITFMVSKADSSSAMAGSPNPAYFGQSVTLTATVTGVAGGSAPTGTVQFSVDGTALGTAQTLIPGTTTSTAQITTATLAVGTHRITADYSGDTNYIASSAGASTTVNPAPFTLTLTSTAISVTAGSMVEFDVQASGNQFPVGQPITFTGLPTSAASPTLDSTGRAVYRFGLFSPATYTIEAHFAGSPSFPATDSNPVTLKVSATSVTVTLASSANPVTYPGTFNLTATATSGGLGVPPGTTVFQNNGTAIGTGTMAVVNGTSGFRLTGNFDATSGSIIAVATGDFNKDGKPDLGVLQRSPNNVTTLSISLGNGDGTFADPVTYTATDGVNQLSSALAAGDFNKDGYSDLAILNPGGSATIFLADADGTGTLRQSQNIQVPANGAIAIGDFNDDGDPDLAVVGSTGVSVLLGTGSGPTVFPQTPSFQYTGTFSPTGMVAADFNHDGYSDLAISNSQGSTVTVLLYNNETGNFDARSYTAGQSATAIAAADFNGNKYPCIAVVSGSDSTVAVLYSLQNGDFAPGISYATSGEPAAITSGDFNGDGYEDFAILGVAGGSGGGTTILFGAPIPDSVAQLKEALIPGAFGQAIATADFNGDGHPDLGIALNSVAAFVDSDAQFAITNVALPVGTHPLTAAYTPAEESIFAPVTSGILNEVVNGVVPVVSLGYSPDPATFGQSVTLNAMVAGVPGNLAPTGSVQFVLNGSIVLGTVPLTLGSTSSTAQYIIAPGGVHAGSHALQALYMPGTGNYLPSSATGTLQVNQAVSVVTWTTPAPIVYGTTLSGLQLNATANPAGGTFTYTPPAGTVLTAGTHPLNVSYAPTDTTDYSPGKASVQIVVSTATPTVILGAILSPPTYGQAITVKATVGGISDGVAPTGTVQFLVDGETVGSGPLIDGTASYTIPANGVHAGSHKLQAVYSGDTNYAQLSSAPGTLLVNQAVPVVTWTTPAPIVYGTALGATQLNATANPADGTFTYTPPAGTTLTGGTHPLNVAYAPTDTTNYTTGKASVQIVVSQATPTVILGAIVSPPTYGPAITVKATVGGIANGVAPTGTVQFLVDGAMVGSGPLIDGTASYTIPANGVHAGSHKLQALYIGDANYAQLSSAPGTLLVNQAVPVVTWATPAPIAYGTALSATQLNATATPAGGTFTYTPPAGTVLPAGTHPLNVSYALPDTTDYSPGKASVQIVVNPPALSLISINPSSGTLGAPATTITLNGTGFLATSVAELNGKAISSKLISPTQLQATIAATVFQKVQNVAITVTQGDFTTTALEFTVAAPPLQGVLSGPPTVQPAEQPTVTFQLPKGYPVPVTGTFTLAVQPATPGGPVDPLVKFSNGSDIYTFTMPAGSTETQAVQLQTGTIVSTITVTLTLQAGGTNVTPDDLQPVAIQVPPAVPTLSSLILTRSGKTLTVTIQGFSNTREMKNAIFHFTASSGSSINNPDVTVNLGPAFTNWYDQSDSANYGSEFTYDQVFILSDDASAIGSVSATLVNTIGNSTTGTAK